MASIRGITIELNGDTTGLTDALNDVNSESKRTQKELKEVEKALKMDPGNADLIAQKQQLLTQSIEGTRDKLDVLRAAQAQVQAQFERGDIGAEQYRAFQRELANTEASLRGYETQLTSLGSEQTRFEQAQRGMQNYLEATGQSIDDLSSTLGSRLTNAIRDGSASSDQLEQALRRMGQAAGHSGDDLQQFQNALRNVDGSNNLDEIRRDLEEIGQAADQAESKMSGLGESIGGALGGLVAGGGLAGAVAGALNDSDVKAIIDVTFDVPEESKASILDAVRTVQTYGVDAEQALEGVRRQWALNGDVSDEVNAKITKDAAAISKAYADIDFWELIQEANEIGGVLGITTEEALAMTDALLKVGFDPNQLDIISEYGNQLKMAGFTALEVQAIMASGVDTKTWNIDNLLDGIKEGRIVGAELGAELSQGFLDAADAAGVSSEKFAVWGKQIAEGGEEGAVAMQSIAKELASVEDETARNTLGTALYGTLWEEQGMKIVDTLTNMGEHMTTADQNAQGMAATVAGLDASAMVQVQTALQNMMTALGPVFEKIAEIVTKIAEWVSNNPQLAATIVAITTAIGILVGIIAVLTPVITAIATAMGVGMAAASGIFLGAIAAIIAVVVAVIAVIQNWGTIWEFTKNAMSVFADWISGVFVAAISGLGSIFSSIWTAISTTTQVLWSGLMSFLSGIWSGIVSNASKIWQMLVSLLSGIWSGIVSLATSTFNGLKNGIVNIFNSVKSTLSNIWNSIKSTLSNLWSGLVSLATSTFSNLRNTVTNTFNSAKNTIVNIWQSVRSSLSSTFSSIVSAASSAFNSMRSTVTSALNSIKSIITSVWNAAKSTVTSAVNSIKSIVTSVFNSLKSTVTSAMNGVKNAIVSGWNAAKSFLSSISLSGIGRNIIQGLANGISNAVGLVKTAVSKLAGLIPDWAKEMLGIHSPSRVMRDQVGYWVGAGVAVGIDKSQSRVATAMEDLGYVLIDEADHWASELIKLEEQLAKDQADALAAKDDAVAKLTEKAAEKVAAIKKKAADKNLKLTAEENAEIEKINKELWKEQAKEKEKYLQNIEKLEKKAAQDRVKNLAAESKAYLDTIKSYIDDKKSLEQLSLKDEAVIWKNSISLFEDGSKERIQAQQNYKKAVETVNKEVESINKTHVDAMQKINDDLKKQTEDITKAYQDEYNKRVESLKKSAGDTFTELKLDTEVTGSDLTTILEDQVAAMTKFDTGIRKLKTRGIAEELFNEISEAGVKALPELTALLNMTDEELTRYNALYVQKNRRAEQLAADELRIKKIWSEAQIKGLEEAAKAELEVLQSTWTTQIQAITEVADEEFASMKQVGIDAATGLYNGLSEMEDPLIKKAREIADAVAKSIKSALDINSPSKLTRSFGVNVGQGLILGMDDMIRKVAASSTRLSEAVATAQSSLANSSARAQQQKVVERQVVQQAAAPIDLNALVQAIAALAARPVETKVVMDGREVAQAVSVHQAQQTRFAGLAKGVSM